MTITATLDLADKLASFLGEGFVITSVEEESWFGLEVTLPGGTTDIVRIVIDDTDTKLFHIAVSGALYGQARFNGTMSFLVPQTVLTFFNGPHE